MYSAMLWGLRHFEAVGLEALDVEAYRVSDFGLDRLI
jgi:hypothetical protein